MMKKFYYLFVLLIGAGLMQACDNGYADSDLIDSPPNVTLSGVPAAVEEGGAPISFTATLKDGISEQHSSTPLASYSYSMVDTTSLAEVRSGGAAVSGRDAVVDVAIDITDGGGAAAVPSGVYELLFTATDTGGNSTPVTNIVTVIECQTAPVATLGVIGSATPTGWDSDTDMTQDPDNPYVWTITMTFVDGEAKFRADNAWALNWGSTGFPSGTGTQDGPNIPVAAGTYDVTINTCTGVYSFN
ncbi:SusF/SusE family outer membrane protein [Fulvivirga sedimenti]|uniref:SusF/SusE family outer membrane protein n=1 Tax=Fulvivirga sedimenti TaxID=2879465 RepID=A0A9X1L3D7_9BACT|nr:SusF/SusE family outer membrane protein [Fulvivirga sedimenti]MCA6079186.1 SusF/SusE family outer membrane protein [Fulvivirga sedimenti]